MSEQTYLLLQEHGRKLTLAHDFIGLLVQIRDDECLYGVLVVDKDDGIVRQLHTQNDFYAVEQAYMRHECESREYYSA